MYITCDGQFCTKNGFLKIVMEKVDLEMNTADKEKQKQTKPGESGRERGILQNNSKYET